MYEVLVSNYFAKQAKRLIKKNRELKETLRTALFNFDKKLAISTGQGVYKLRIARRGKGKSGGYRLYIYVIEINKILTPIAIYSKNQKENLTLNELNNSLERVKEELKSLI